MNDESYRLRTMTVADVDEVVEIHLQAFHGFFLTRMGRGFLRIYYDTVLAYDGSIALVCDQQNQASCMRGFVVGFSEPHLFYSQFSERRLELLPHMCFAILRNPLLIFQVLRNSRRVEEARETLQQNIVELSSIAVGAQGGGVGSKLVEAFVDAAKSTGAKEIELTTDRDRNDRIRRFYEKRGFVLEGFQDRGRRSLCVYRLKLS